jgi:hypothetical protein
MFNTKKRKRANTPNVLPGMLAINRPKQNKHTYPQNKKIPDIL